MKALGSEGARTGQRLALIGNQAFSMLNFRGQLIRDVVARGHEVFAFAPDFDAVSRAEISDMGAVPMDHGFQRTEINPLKDAAAVAKLVGTLRGLRLDAALGYSIKPVTYGLLAAWAAGVPRRYAMIEGLGHVFMRHDTVTAGLLRAGVSLLYRTSLRRARRTFFLNPDDRRDFLAMRLVNAEKSEVIGGIGVDLSTWRAAPPVTEPMTFVFVGRLLREKGVVELIEAMRQVKAARPDTKLVLLGDVDSNPSSLQRAQVAAWVAEELLTWPGQVEVAPWLAKCSVFVLPSYREGVPRSTQEAMAMARPVITTDVPGCRETVIDGRNGFLVPPRDAGALARVMLRFAETPELVATMGRESRVMAEERFDVVKTNERLVAGMGLASA